MFAASVHASVMLVFDVVVAVKPVGALGPKIAASAVGELMELPDAFTARTRQRYVLLLWTLLSEKLVLLAGRLAASTVNVQVLPSTSQRSTA